MQHIKYRGTMYLLVEAGVVQDLTPEYLKHMQRSDRVRVFHGTYIATGVDPDDAPQNMVFGIDSLKQSTSRYHDTPGFHRYRGLFVAPTYEGARHFGNLVFEFHVKAGNLHATDWSANISRKWDIDKKELVKQCQDLYPGSFNPELSCSLDTSSKSKGHLFRGVEPQALFIGMVPASNIVAVHYDEKRYTPDEFIQERKKDIAWEPSVRGHNLKSTTLTLDQYLAGIQDSWGAEHRPEMVRNIAYRLVLRPEEAIDELVRSAPLSIAAAERFVQLFKQQYADLLADVTKKTNESRKKRI